MKAGRAISIFGLVAVTFLLFSCQSYERQVVPFKMPAAYPNAKDVGGATIAAKAYDDPAEASAAFGFDMRGSGVLPVQIVFDNRSPHTFEINSAQTFLIDTANNLWPILDASLVYSRIEKQTQMGKVLPEAGKGAVLGGAAGAVLGAAIGIVTGTNVGQAAARGAAAGAAAGAVVGGTSGYVNRDAQYQIREDLQKRTLEARPVKPGEIAYGFVFFPGEAAKSQELRLQLREVDTGRVHALVFGL